jgi:hypothetical protein
VPSFVEVVTASQGLLPSPCSECLWWQTASGTENGLERRLAWMSNLEQSWGSVGIVGVEGRETTSAIQFAPARALPRSFRLPVGPPPDESVLLFCLRSGLRRPSFEGRQVLHRALRTLRGRGVLEAYAYARPLGSNRLCAARNLCGLEFLLANGFQVMGGNGEVFLTRVDLRGLLPSLSEAVEALRRLRHPSAAPSPIAFRWLH